MNDVELAILPGFHLTVHVMPFVCGVLLLTVSHLKFKNNLGNLKKKYSHK